MKYEGLVLAGVSLSFSFLGGLGGGFEAERVLPPPSIVPSPGLRVAAGRLPWERQQLLLPLPAPHQHLSLRPRVRWAGGGRGRLISRRSQLVSGEGMSAGKLTGKRQGELVTNRY